MSQGCIKRISCSPGQPKLSIAVGRLAPVHQWDQTMLDDLFSNTLYPTGLQFRRWEGYPGYPDADGCILLAPGRYWAGHEAEISTAVERYAWLLLIVTGDEEGTFDSGKVAHPRCRYWIQTPRQDKEYPEARFFGVGYTPHMRGLPKEPPTKDLDVVLSAQRTHKRRDEAFEALDNVQCSKLVEETAGFTQGMLPGDYTAAMARAKVCPAPSGAISPDSFRLYEALQAHAIPIADDCSPVYASEGYWEGLFPGCPFPILRDYASLPGYIDAALEGWPANANQIATWWILQKRRMSQWLRDDLKALGAL